MSELREAMSQALHDLPAWAIEQVGWMHGSPTDHSITDVADALVAALPPGTALIGPAEMAVIEAAKAWHAPATNPAEWEPEEHRERRNALLAAVDALMEAER